MSVYSAILVQSYCALHCLDWLLIFSFVFPVKAFSKLRWNEELRYIPVQRLVLFVLSDNCSIIHKCIESQHCAIW